MNTESETPANLVLAAVDVSGYAPSVASLAGWAAQRLDCKLALLHALQPASTAQLGDLSGNLALGVQEELLEQLVQLDEKRERLAMQQGEQMLGLLQRQVQEQWQRDADVSQRHGMLLETLLELQPETRLLVIGKRGEHADFASGHLGSNLERVVRAIDKPVLVASRQWRPVQRFLIAFDGSPASRKAVQMICRSPLLKGLECHLLMVGDTRRQHREALDWAREQLQGAGFDALLQLKSGEPEALIAAHVQSEAIDMLVMGAYGHTRIRSLLLGSTTTALLRSCPVPVLLLR